MSADPTIAAEAHYKIGDIYFRQGKTQLEVREYLDTLKLNPKHVRARIALGFAYARLRMYAKALKQLDETFEARSQERSGLLLPRLRALRLKRPDEAIASFLQAIKLRPRFAEAHYLPGPDLRREGRKGQGHQTLQCCDSCQPTYDEGRAWR